MVIYKYKNTIIKLSILLALLLAGLTAPLLPKIFLIQIYLGFNNTAMFLSAFFALSIPFILSEIHGKYVSMIIAAVVFISLMVLPWYVENIIHY